MSVSLTTPGLIFCDGDRWPCRAMHDAGTHCTAREARQEAKVSGWAVNVRQAGSRKRLDFCPRHG
jgi:hypothetical protein